MEDRMNRQKTLTFWFDLETAPDVLFFEPIAKRLKEMNHTIYITCRNYSDVPDLAKLHGIEGATVGWHGGKSKAKKILIGLLRSSLLAKWARKKNIDFAVGFGSRPLGVASTLLGIPNACVFDYEHALKFGCRFHNWMFTPEEVSTQFLVKEGIPEERLIKYHGLKEEVYTGVYKYDVDSLKHLEYDENKVIVTIRPPATKATYHDRLSEVICRRVLERIARDPSILALFLRRDDEATFDEFLEYENIKRVTVPVKGLDLIVKSDLVISGGGTMVREAAALGVPAYSIFAGKKGAVDDRLAHEGHLVLIRRPEDVTKVRFVKRDKQLCGGGKNRSVLEFFVNEFIRLASNGRSS
jgi:predicted glycosyltransferase